VTSPQAGEAPVAQHDSRARHGPEQPLAQLGVGRQERPVRLLEVGVARRQQADALRRGRRVERAHVLRQHPARSPAGLHLGELALELVPHPARVRLRNSRPLREVAWLSRPVVVKEAPYGLGGRRSPPAPPARVTSPGVQPHAGLHRGVAPQHRCHVMAAAAPAPRHEVGAHPLPQRLVQLVLVEPAAVRERVARGRRHIRERGGRCEPLLRREPLDLPPELSGELGVVASDQGAAVERVVVRGQRVDRPADDVGDHQLAAVDGLLVRLTGQALGARGQRKQRRVAREVRGGAGSGLRKVASAAVGQPRAGQPEGKHLLGIHSADARSSRARWR
jgi:hypothetical protein